MKVKFSYLDRQFSELQNYLDDIKEVALNGDFTLGEGVGAFERQFADHIGQPHGVAVASGTDALIMPLKLMGIGSGDEVITCVTTFIATLGAIVAVGATPVLVDCDEGFVIDVEQIEDAITERTKAILPVHYTGNVANMSAIMEIAERHELLIIEDASQAIGASFADKPVGSWGIASAFSLHPLKSINVWGDGGVILTRDGELAEQLRLYRNHGLRDRDNAEIFGINSRLDTIQAVVGSRLLQNAAQITENRIRVAERYDSAFRALNGAVSVPHRRQEVRHVFHLYILRVERRDELYQYLNDSGIEAKIHYPKPVHMQTAAKELGYGKGSFPFTESDAERIISLPLHQYLAEEEIEFVIKKVRDFYLS
jgi:dTDP-4-amino-4,6-dideoxygalactose transaminase